MACLSCRADAVVEALDLGAHPVASFFVQPDQTDENAVPLAIGGCGECGAIQLMTPTPAAALTPPYDWLFAREPEAHLDQVVDGVLRLPAVSAAAAVVGLTAKDDTTVARFRDRGHVQAWTVGLSEDLGVETPAAGIETVQKLTTPARMREIASAKELAGILIVRHILEHAEDPLTFLAGCAELMADGGYIMLEVPDCIRSLELKDYSMVWEEHSLYLTPYTFEQLVRRAGFEVVSLEIYPFPFENSLVLIGRKGGSALTVAGPAQAEELGRLAAYAESLPAITADLRTTLTEARRRGPVAIFGAGHLACAFVNFHGLADLIDFVADDTPQKQGLRLPGAKLPILPSTALIDRRVALCLLAVSPQSEDTIIARNAAFVSGGGIFRSVLAASERSIRRGLT
jgi:hypothetical protein